MASLRSATYPHRNGHMMNDDAIAVNDHRASQGGTRPTSTNLTSTTPTTTNPTTTTNLTTTTTTTTTVIHTKITQAQTGPTRQAYAAHEGLTKGTRNVMQIMPSYSMPDASPGGGKAGDHQRWDHDVLLQ